MSLLPNSNQYFAHDADIGIIGQGQTLEEAFEQAAIAMFAIMADLAKVKVKHKVQFSFEESDIELAFVTWLNRLLAESYRLNIVFCRFKLEKQHAVWNAKAWGQSWTEINADHGTEVKGATLTWLSVTKIEQGWEARCVVDV